MSAKHTADQLRALLNGPILAGVGATVDAGLTRDKFHVLLWGCDNKTVCTLEEGVDSILIKAPNNKTWIGYDLDKVLATAIYNVDKVYDYDGVASKIPSLGEDFTSAFKVDLVAILALSMAHNYYQGECRKSTDTERKSIDGVAVTADFRADVFNAETLNRAATFILARMHTKYQTNHAIGGTPMQASMASSVRAFYQVSEAEKSPQPTKDKTRFIASALYWALHPLNETLLIPHVIKNSKITSTLVHSDGPIPTPLVVEEYFNIRAQTPPASTHHYYVAAAAIRALEPMGILPYLPDPTRTKDIVAGLMMISTHGAKLHPAARFWGLERMTSNQKIVETICADLGYAVKKLLPVSSLAASPILKKEDQLNSAWKSFIDSLRAMIDERGKDLMDEGIFKEIANAIAPNAGTVEGVTEIKRYLITGSVEEVEDSDDEEEEEEAEKPKSRSGGSPARSV
jgi:hypothetical protein